MLKAVLDTSILISAFLNHNGVNNQILQKGKDHYLLYLSEDILEETRRVLLTYDRLRKKYKYTDEEIVEYVEILRIVAKQVIKETPIIKVIKADPNDDFILACALKIKADYLVSKDNHLKYLKKYEGITIVSSQDFLQIISHAIN